MMTEPTIPVVTRSVGAFARSLFAAGARPCDIDMMFNRPTMVIRNFTPRGTYHDK